MAKYEAKKIRQVVNDKNQDTELFKTITARNYQPELSREERENT